MDLKRQRFTASLMAVALLLTACGASSKDSAASTAPQASPQESVNGFYDGVSPESMEVPESEGREPRADRKIIKHVDLNLESTDFETSLARITQAVEQAGGYMERQEVTGRSIYNNDEYYSRYAYLNARVPTDRLEEVRQAVGGVCNVTSASESMDDITDRYFDTAAHLNAMEVRETRLLELLEQAQTLEDIITLESALSDVRYEIESLTAALKRMDNQVSYSYLNMELQEVTDYSLAKAKPRTFLDRLNESFGRSWRNLTRSLEGLLFFLIEEGPVLIIYAAIFLAIYLVVRRIVRAIQPHMKKRTPPPPPAPWGYPPHGPAPKAEEPKKEE